MWYRKTQNPADNQVLEGSYKAASNTIRSSVGEITRRFVF
jgi:hypothetical protein